jgi:hypothetical protein
MITRKTQKECAEQPMFRRDLTHMYYCHKVIVDDDPTGIRIMDELPSIKHDRRLPGVVEATGEPLYYVGRHLDYVARHGGESDPPSYYLGYGYPGCIRFLTEKRKFSDQGQAWILQTAVALQEQLEASREENPDYFAGLEEDSDRFYRYAIRKHPDAYMLNEDFLRLPLSDLGRIAVTPFIKAVLGAHGLATIPKLATPYLGRFSLDRLRGGAHTKEPVNTPPTKTLPDKIGPFYWYERIMDCVNNGRICPEYYEIAAIVDLTLHIRTRDLLTDAGKEWIDTVSRNLQLHTESHITQDPRSFANLEQRKREFNAMALRRHRQAYASAGGLRALPRSDRYKITQNIAKFVPPEMAFVRMNALREFDALLRSLFA